MIFTGETGRLSWENSAPCNVGWIHSVVTSWLSYCEGPETTSLVCLMLRPPVGWLPSLSAHRLSKKLSWLLHVRVVSEWSDLTRQLITRENDRSDKKDLIVSYDLDPLPGTA